MMFSLPGIRMCSFSESQPSLLSPEGQCLGKLGAGRSVGLTFGMRGGAGELALLGTSLASAAAHDSGDHPGESFCPGHLFWPTFVSFVPGEGLECHSESTGCS